jgi:hypothetical protein
MNDHATRMCFYKCWAETGRPFSECPRFDDCVKFIGYGDDQAVNVKSEIKSWFNQRIAQIKMRELGYDYTSALKDGVIVDTKPLSELSFLKRSFKWDPTYCMYVAPMELSNILEQTNWVRGNLVRTSTLENCENALTELALLGKDVYEEWSVKIQIALREQELDLNVKPYEYWEQYYASVRGQ